MTKRPALVLFALCILLSAARPPVSAAAFRVPTRSTEPGATSQEVLSAPVYVPADSTRAAQPPLTRFTRGTVSRGAAFDQVINLVLDQYAAAIPELPWYAVTDITSAGEASLVSVVGLATTELASGWSIEQGGWFGLLLIAPAPAGGWLGALSGTPAFTALLDEIPDSIMSAETRTNLDPRRRSEQSNGYIFPWEPGTAMEYVSGVHQNGFADYTPGWLAVDFISTYDPESGMAPPAVYAAAAGTIDWKCSPYWGQTSAAIRIGELMYVHLVNTPDLATGRSLAQGEVIGYMQPGEFNENCGVARQGSGQYHLHLGFPATRTLTLEGWTLNLRDHKFYKGAEARGVHSLFIAGEDSPAGKVMTMLGAEVGGGGQAQAGEEALPLDLQLWLEGRKGAVRIQGKWIKRMEGE